MRRALSSVWLLVALVLASSWQRPRRPRSAPQAIVVAPAEAQTRCTTDTFALHDDPLQLVTEFVRRDAAGRLPVKKPGYTDWLDGALTCAERASSSVSEVITAYSVKLLVSGADTARVLVRRTRAFTVRWDSASAAYHPLADPADEADTVVVIRTRHSWRIDTGISGAHRMPAAAAADLPDLTFEDRHRLRQTAMGLGGLSMDSIDLYTIQDLPRVWVNVGGEGGEPATCLILTADGVGRFIGDTLFNPVRWTYTPKTGDLALALPRLDSAYLPALLNAGWESPSVAHFNLDVPSRTLHYSLYRNTTSLPIAGWAYVKAGDVPSWQWESEPIPCRHP